ADALRSSGRDEETALFGRTKKHPRWDEPSPPARVRKPQPMPNGEEAEKWGLNLFRLMATWLIEAHIAGRSDRPEFAELRDMAKDVTDAIQRGEPFRGYRDEPEKKARLKMLVAALDRP